MKKIKNVGKIITCTNHEYCRKFSFMNEIQKFLYQNCKFVNICSLDFMKGFHGDLFMKIDNCYHCR